MFQWLKSRRTRQMETILNDIAHEVSPYVIPLSIYQAALRLRRHMQEQGVELSMDEACRRVDAYRPVKRN